MSFIIRPSRFAATPWIDLNATQFTEGDTGTFSWSGFDVTSSALDDSIGTGNTFIASATDFDFEVTGTAFGSANGPYVGFYDNGTAGGSTFPTPTDDTVHIVNGGGSPGYEHANAVTDTGGGKSAGFMASTVVRMSRRGSTYYAYLDDVLDHTYVDVSGNTAGGLYIGNGGGTASWTLNSVRYRAGAGLP